MRKVLALMGILTMFGFGTSAAATQNEKPSSKTAQTCTLKVEGMSCSACASKVEKTALKIDGVKTAKVDSRKGTAEIAYDAAKTNPDSIAKTITDKSGFKAEAPKSTPKK